VIFLKKIVQINVVCNGSTGKIMDDISLGAINSGFESYCFYGRGCPGKNGNFIKIGNKLSVFIHVLLTRFLNKHGHGSYFATKSMIRKIKKINPDIIQLHNIHGYYLNIKVLFDYLKKDYKGKVVWTLHDCWAFTGHCAHFTAINCNRWKNECYKCPQKSEYPKSFFVDTSTDEYIFKKKLFLNVNNMKLVVVSEWLKKLVDKSFLSNYDIRVINNGIDLSIFTPNKSKKILNKYNIPKNKNIILGVSNIWNNKKGLNIFLDLSKLIKPEEIIVLVGLTDEQKKSMPNNIIGINRTNNQQELADLYSISSVFLNPSIEETFSLVTLEAIACATPVIVGGASATKELVTDKVGIVVNSNSAEEYYKAYVNLNKKSIEEKDLLYHAKNYTKERYIKKYIELYEE